MTMLNNIKLSPRVGFFRHGDEIVMFRVNHLSHEPIQHQADRMKIEVEVLSMETIDEKTIT